ncbi:galactose mutarotase [soil metagenome]
MLNKGKFQYLIIVISIYFISCDSGTRNDAKSESSTDPLVTITEEPFGETSEGKPISLFTLSNQKGMEVKITNYGGIITSLTTLDKNRNPGDIVLGFDNLEAYKKGHPHFGPIIGRYSGFINEGKFTLDGQEYSLATNAGKHHLHGGRNAFDKAVWEAEKMETQQQASLKLSYLSPDGEEGYPGNFNTTVVYTLTDNNELRIDFQAETDKKTLVNLTNHSYFNLSAGESDHNGQHVLTIHADRYAVVDDTMIPTGELRNVAGTPADFTNPTPINKGLEQLSGGFDHNYVLKDQRNNELKLAASVHEPVTGRYMELHTTISGLEFASANWLDGSHEGKNGEKYTKSYGFLLYPQQLPDSPNNPEFPTAVLEPGAVYKETTVYKFSTR